MTRRSVESGTVLTVQHKGSLSGESVTMYGLASDQGSKAGQWWPWASFRMVGAAILMLTCTGVGGKATWVQVATVRESRIDWQGMPEYSADSVTGARQVMRCRLVVVAMRHIGYDVSAEYTDAWDDKYMTILGEVRCAVCMGALTSARSIEAGVGPECSGLAQARRTRTAAKRQHAKGLSVEEMRKRIQS